MKKQLRVISVNFQFRDQSVLNVPLETDRALFDFDVVVIKPPRLGKPNRPLNNREFFNRYQSLMLTKKNELHSFFLQGGVLVLFLDVPDFYHFQDRQKVDYVDNYDFLDGNFRSSLVTGTGDQITYSATAEPFIGVLKKSVVAWTTYIRGKLVRPFDEMIFFARAGAAGALAGKMAYEEGHIIILPNVKELDEPAFFEACGEYRFKRQGTSPPEWVAKLALPGIDDIEAAIRSIDVKISDLHKERSIRSGELEQLTAYRKLLYEKGKDQLEPIVLRALDDLDFATRPGEIISGTIHEIDGRTSNGSTPGIVEVKGSKNQVAQSEFSPLVTKILADAEVRGKYSKGILVGNGLCETEPGTRLGNSVFSQHVLDGARRNSVALINSVELYWLCCALLRGDQVDKNTIREAILTGNGYIDLKPFSGPSPFI